MSMSLYTATMAADRALAAAATAKTLLSVVAEAGKSLEIVEFGMAFDGADSSQEPILIELCRSTQATAGTSTSVTIAHFGGQDLSADATAAENFSVEPTVLTRISAWLWPPYAGSFVMQYPLGERPNAADLGADALCLRCTIPSGGAATNGRGYILFRE